MSKELSQEHKEKLHGIIRELLSCEISEVVPDVSLTNLGADSLDEVEIVMIVEKEFDIEINDDVAEGIVLVSDYYPIIANLL